MSDCLWNSLKNATRQQIGVWIMRHRMLSPLQCHALLQEQDDTFYPHVYDLLKKKNTAQSHVTFGEWVIRQNQSLKDQTPQRFSQDEILKKGQLTFKINQMVKIFDEIPASLNYHDHFSKPLFKPIPAKIIQIENEGKKIRVQFLSRHIWYEAGGWYVQKNQTMWFYYDPITHKWLREGLTPEVCESWPEQGPPRYFELSYTRQYLCD